MRFRNRCRVAVLLAGAAALCAFAAAEQVRSELAARLKPAMAQVENPAPDPALAAPLLEQGRKLWLRRFANGRSLAGCFPNGGRRIAATYPHYDARLKRVLTLEMAINQCLRAHGEALYEPADPQTMGVVTAYVRSLAEGQKVTVRVPAAAEPRYEDGRRLYFSRLGQRNYACASCHVQGAGKRFEDRLIAPAVGQAARWPFIRDGAALTLQARMRECLERMGAAPFPAGSDELNHLEYFLTQLSNGLPLRPNAPASP
jgi:L-cysteine S-thiosulfotransferase